MTQPPQYPTGANEGPPDGQDPAPPPPISYGLGQGSLPPPPPYSYQPPPTYIPVQYQPVVVRPVPTILTTLLITLFFGIFGLIPTIMHTTRARDAGQPTGKYWITFGCVMVGAFLLWFLMFGILAASSTPTTYYTH